MSTARVSSASRLALTLYGCMYLLFLGWLHPDVDWQDSGELIAAAHLLAPAHFLGYPLYVLPAKALSLLPLGAVAVRVNLFSALLASITLATVVAAAFKWIPKRLGPEGAKDNLPVPLALWTLAGFSAAVAFSRGFTVQATQAENTIPAVLILVLGLNSLAGSPTARRVTYVFFSLFAAYHPALLPVALLGGLSISLASPKGMRIREMAIYGAVQAVVVSVNLFLLLRSSASPPLSYTYADSWAALVSTVQVGLQKYRGSNLVSPIALTRAFQFTRESLPQIFVVVTPLALYGLYRLVRRHLRLSMFVVPMLVLFVALALLNPSQEREGYALLAIVVLLWLSGMGLAAMRSFAARRAAVVLLTLMGITGWFAAASNLFVLAREGSRHSPVARRVGDQILAEMRGKAIYVANNERLAFVAEYLQFVELRRPDVALAFLPLFTTDEGARRIESMHPHLAAPMVRLPSGQFTCALPITEVYASQLVERNIGRYPLYTDAHAAWSFPSRIDGRTMSAFVRTGVKDFRDYIRIAAEGLTVENLRYRFSPSPTSYAAPLTRRGILYSYDKREQPIPRQRLVEIWNVSRPTPTDEEVLTQVLYQWASYDFARGRLSDAVLGYQMAGSSYRKTT